MEGISVVMEMGVVGEEEEKEDEDEEDEEEDEEEEETIEPALTSTSPQATT